MLENITSKQTMNIRSSVLKILVCYHKPYIMPPLEDGILLPIQGGKALSSEDFGIQGDNEINGRPCDNISDKNESYSELTAIYWAWKNLKKLYPEVQYVGLFHYRRFFAFDDNKFFDVYIKKQASEIQDYKINSQEIISILETGKIILSKRLVFPFSLAMQYCLSHFSEHYRSLFKVMKENFPDYYDDFLNVMEKNNKLHAFNMFIMKYDDFVKYCEWLFSVFDALEKEISYQYFSLYQKRVPAFMAERLFHTYITKNKIPAKSVNVYFYDDNDSKDISQDKSIFGKMFACVRRFRDYCKDEINFRVYIFLYHFSLRSFIKKLITPKI